MSKTTHAQPGAHRTDHTLTLKNPPPLVNRGEPLAITLPHHYKDTIGLRLGGSLFIPLTTEAGVTMRMGGFYDSSASADEDLRLDFDTLAKLGKAAESIEATRAALALAPDDAELSLELASRFIDAQQYEEAQRMLEGQARDPGARGELLLRLGYAHLMPGHTADAAHCSASIALRAPHRRRNVKRVATCTATRSLPHPGDIARRQSGKSSASIARSADKCIYCPDDKLNRRDSRQKAATHVCARRNTCCAGVYLLADKRIEFGHKFRQQGRLNLFNRHARPHPFSGDLLDNPLNLRVRFACAFDVAGVEQGVVNAL